MSQTLNTAIAVIGIDIGKNSFHIVGHDKHGAIVLRQKWSRGQVEARLANLPPCLIGMEACVGAHHLSRKLNSLGHDARLMPAKYVRPYPCLPAGARDCCAAGTTVLTCRVAAHPGDATRPPVATDGTSDRGLGWRLASAR